jgi:hypothetical protein
MMSWWLGESNLTVKSEGRHRLCPAQLASRHSRGVRMVSAEPGMHECPTTFPLAGNLPASAWCAAEPRMC